MGGIGDANDRPAAPWAAEVPSRSAAAELAARSAAGDELAFAELYDLLAPMVFGLCHRVLRSSTLAEEVTQDVFVELWRHGGRFDAGRASVGTWAAIIAHRRAVDRVRREQHERTVDHTVDDVVFAAKDAESRRPEAQVLQAELARTVREAMGRLDPQVREVVDLAYYGGLTHVQIATRLAVPVRTVKSRLYRGFHTLRNTLDVG